MYGVFFIRSAQKEFDNIDAAHQTKVRAIIADIACDPLQGKPLQGKLKGLYSIRAWPFRIVYEIHKRQLYIIVLAIAHRKDAYR